MIQEHVGKSISCRVLATPVQQGDLSWSPISRRLYYQNNKKLRPYKKQIALAMMLRMGEEKCPVFTGPVLVTITFFFERPKTVKREYPTVRPDVDKLTRAVLDALTGVVYDDDGQVVNIHAEKRYADRDSVSISVLEEGKGMWV